MEDFRGTLKKAQRANADAFAEIWREYHPGLVRYLRVKCGSAAEDLAADTWLKVVRNLPGFKGTEDNFQAWLFTMARNRLTDWYRKGSRSREVLSDGEILLSMPSVTNVEEEAAERSATDSAVEMIATLPADQAEAVMLRIVNGLDVATVADLMGRTPGSVRVLCHRGLRTLERQVVAEQRRMAAVDASLGSEGEVGEAVVVPLGVAQHA